MISPEVQKLLDDPRFPMLLKAIGKTSEEIVFALKQELLPRDIALGSLTRFEAVKTMFYRDNVLYHGYRIDSMVVSIMLSIDMLFNKVGSGLQFDNQYNRLCI